MSKNLFLLYKLRHYFNQNEQKIFYFAHCLSHIKYASCVWFKSSQELINKLNSLHRRGIKLICDIQNISTDEKFSLLKIMSQQSIFPYNVAMLVYKSINNLSSPYLKLLIYHSHYRETRLKIPSCRMKLSQSRFSYIGPKIWNTLPLQIHCSQSIGRFRIDLKTFFLNHES